MAALNFPTTDLEAGVTEYSANGTTYLWDGVKWVGRTAGGAAGTNSIQNNGNTVQVDAGGNLALPEYSLPNTVGTTGQVLKWPASGTTLAWSTDNNSGGSADLDKFKIVPAGEAGTSVGLATTDDATGYGGYNMFLSPDGEGHSYITIPNNAEAATGESLRIGGTGANSAVVIETYNGNWTFGNTGNLTAPWGYLTIDSGYESGLVGMVAQDTEMSTRMLYSSGNVASTITSTQPNVPTAGYPPSVQISLYDDSSTPSATTWTFGLDGTLSLPLESKLSSGGGVPNSAEIGTTVTTVGEGDIETSEVFMGSGYGEFRSIYNKTSPLESGLVYAGVEGFNYVQQGDVNFAGMVSQTPNIDSMYALSLNEQGQIVIGFTQDGQTQTSTDWSVVVGTLTTDYTVNGLFANTTTTVIGTGLSSWKFGSDGILNFPNNNGQIGQLEAPYTGLEFRTGSGADWIGISYGEINDNNTSYFYFDKDGSDYLTDNHRAHLQLKNAARDGHVEWLFDVTGNLTLPVGGDILDSTGQSVLGGGGNANTGNFTFDADTITNGDGLILDTNRGTLAIGTNMEGIGGPTHLHIAFDGSNVDPPANDLFLGDDYNYVKLPGSELPVTPYGVEIGAHNRDGGNNYVWRFGTDGNLSLPQGSTIGDQATSVDLTVGRASDNPYWYNLFGDTGATIDANITINGSVVRDTGGNVYALGSLIHGDGSFDADNLFLKYSVLGELLWRRTWTDDNGLNCGSYNASLRYIEANVDLGTQDTLLWAAWVPNQDLSYVGTMDMEGNVVDQFGDPRFATRLDNVKVTDLEWIGEPGNGVTSLMLFVGQYYESGTGSYIPFTGAVNLDTSAVTGDTTVTPAGSDQSFSGLSNTFKAMAPSPISGISAVVGTYHDGTYNHAMLAISGDGPPTTIGIGVDNYSTDNVSGEDLCCDANGNVYVIVNNISSGYAVLIKTNINNLAQDPPSTIWQKQLGFELPAGDTFQATAVAHYQNHVYVLGQYYDDATGDTDAMIIKVNEYTGVVWQRRISSPGDDGVSFYGSPGLESSSGITVEGGLIAVSFATEARTPGLGGTEFNTVTLSYPVDGSILGTFGDFVISDFSVGHTDTNYSVTELTTTLGSENVTSGFATLNPTVQTVGTGWTNTQWDLENNIQIFDPQTFKFNVDGTFDTAEIKHQGEVKITANTTVANAVPSTWTFQNNDGLRFPDGTVQYGAYIETEMALDGGSAVSVYNILPRPPVADGGGSASRFGINDPVYDGSGGNDYVLDGGGA